MKNCLLNKTSLWEVFKPWSRSIEAQQIAKKVKTVEEIKEMDREFTETLMLVAESGLVKD